MTQHKSTKVLVYGNVFRDYRSQVLVKLLLDAGYHVSLTCPDYYLTQRRSPVNFFYLGELWLKALFADVIYLSPMNTRFIKSAIWAAKAFRKKLVVEMYISIYDTFVGDGKLLKGKQIAANSRQAKSMLHKDVLALTQSDFIIHTASHELNYWEQLLDTKIDRERVAIAPNFNVSRLVHRKSRNGSLRICWWGTFIPLHGLENILQAMQILQTRQIDFTCNLFGIDHESFATYTAKIKQLQLEDRVELRKDLRFSDRSLPEYLVDNCDLALGIFGNTDKAYNTVPNKLIEALSMAIPTLTMKSPALNEFFDPKTDLWTCEATPEAIADAIVTIAGGSAHPVDWQTTREKVLTTFSVTKYRDVVQRVLARVTNISPEIVAKLTQYEQQISQSKC